MSLFQCENCGCCENTVFGTDRWQRFYFDWTGIEYKREMALCSVCMPTKYADGKPTKGGKWHGKFPRRLLPKGMFKTNKVGNLEHKETGSENYSEYEIND